MKNSNAAHVTSFSFLSAAHSARRQRKRYLPDPAGQHDIPALSNQYARRKHENEGKADSHGGRTNNLGKRVDCLAHGICEHGKLRLGAKILRAGGMEKIYKQNFCVREGEKLLKASQCYLSTTAGPIAGLLFISTDKVAFCSEKSIKLTSQTGESLKFHYKVLIPLGKIKRAAEGENVKKPAQRYIVIATADGFECWFMGFLNHQKTFKYLRQAAFSTEAPKII